jgi:hypothetical protein
MMASIEEISASLDAFAGALREASWTILSISGHVSVDFRAVEETAPGSARMSAVEEATHALVGAMSNLSGQTDELASQVTAMQEKIGRLAGTAASGSGLRDSTGRQRKQERARIVESIGTALDLGKALMGAGEPADVEKLLDALEQRHGQVVMEQPAADATDGIPTTAAPPAGPEPTPSGKSFRRRF